MTTTALKLSERYFHETAAPLLRTELPDIYAVAAAGLVGNGSECFGYDDELSRDHDWGTDFFLWLPESHQCEIPRVMEWKQKLFTNNPPPHPRSRSEYGAHISILTCGEFYRQLIGTPDGMMEPFQWLRIPEANLAMCVNGKVFLDQSGVFTEIRHRLLAHYPEDVRKKKIAAKCMALAQTGQYNLARTTRRGDWVTVNTIIAMFVQQAIALVFLLNRVYRPYYKWEYRMLGTLPILGAEISGLLSQLIAAPAPAQAGLAVQEGLISRICALLRAELRQQNLSQSMSEFFADLGQSVQDSIEHEGLRNLPAQFE